MTDNFMRFWKTLNQFQSEQGLPDILYGDARRWFALSGIKR